MFSIKTTLLLLLVILTVCFSSTEGQCPSSSFVDPENPLFPVAPRNPTAVPTAPSPPSSLAPPSPRPPVIQFAGNSEVAQLSPFPTFPNPTFSARTNCPHAVSGLKRWHDPSTWPGNAVPVAVAGADFTLPENSNVLLSSCSLPSDVFLGTITIPATSSLVFADANITLHVAGFNVMGQLKIGSATCRLVSNINIVLHGARPVSTTPVPAEHVKGIAVTGQLDIHGALYTVTWSRLASTAEPGDQWIFLQDLVNWEEGQTIAILTTTLKDSKDYHENEVRTISAVYRMPSVGAGISAIKLNETLTRKHYAGTEYQGEVSLLSRRIIVQGYEADSEPTDGVPVACSDDFFSSYPCANELTGYGGHIIVRGASALGRISGALLYRMGQTNFLGRYPLHFHMVGVTGDQSYVQDTAVWRSFFRCFAVHGTNNTRLSRNVVYDAVGHCYYLEDGVEEGNLFEYNIGAFIKMIGSPPSNKYGFGQSLPDFFSNDDLILPADITASAFYITNSNNDFKGNAASGGWSGFAFPNLIKPIGLNRNVGLNPLTRPTSVFDGNTAHSSGYWWDQAGCIYVGGTLEYSSSDSNVLRYNPGRDTSRNHSPINNGFMQFNNTKTFLCSVGFMHWGNRIEFRKYEAHDMMRSMTVFGQVYMTQMLINCRSRNQPSIPGSKWYERRFLNNDLAAFQWYDTGQSHIMTNTTFRNCVTTNRKMYAWQLLTHSDQFIPDMMQASSNIRYENVSESTLISFSVTNHRTTSGRLQNWLDPDGSTALRNGKPSILGSLYANDWWKLDDNCINRTEWNMWVCDKTPSRNIAAFKVKYDAAEQVKVGGQNCSNGDHKPCTAIGYVTHVGYTDPSQAMMLTLNTLVTGPTNGFGWFLWFVKGAAREVILGSMQIYYQDSVVLVMQYPPNTNFVITATAAYCTGSWCLGSWQFSKANSSSEIAQGPGDVYYFDGNYLYVRIVAQKTWDIGVNKKWAIANVLDGFQREGINIPGRTWDGYELNITALCTPTTPGGKYCPITLKLPQTPCKSGVQNGYDACGEGVEGTGISASMAIGGIVGGVVVLALVALAAAVVVIRRRRTSKSRSSDRYSNNKSDVKASSHREVAASSPSSSHPRHAPPPPPRPEKNVPQKPVAGGDLNSKPVRKAPPPPPPKVGLKSTTKNSSMA